MQRAHELDVGAARTTVRPRRRPRNGVLALQQAAGNRAVGAILARQPGTKEEQEQRTSHVLLPNIGRLELVSFQWGLHKGREGGEGHAYDDINVTTAFGKHSTALLLAATNGTTFKELQIVHYGSSGAGIRLTLTDAVIVSYQLGSGDSDKRVENWTLTFGTVKHEYIKAEE
jgi:Type VI secretion system effector, Hcp